jgi:cytochrome P450
MVFALSSSMMIDTPERFSAREIARTRSRSCDVLGFPDLVPRLSRLRVRPTLRFFDAAVDTIIARRRRLLAEDPDNGPADLLPLRSMIVIAPYVLHRHRRLWERPDVFDPTRFLEAARERIDRFAYLPFGVGPRVCIGAAFALQEATLVLATITRSVTLELAAGHSVWPIHSVTLRPRGGMPMTATKRR